MCESGVDVRWDREIKKIVNRWSESFNWGVSSLSKLTPMIFNAGLTHFRLGGLQLIEGGPQNKQK